MTIDEEAWDRLPSGCILEASVHVPCTGDRALGSQPGQMLLYEVEGQPGASSLARRTHESDEGVPVR